MYIELNNNWAKSTGMIALGLVLLLLSILASANLDGVTLNTPPNDENISGIYTLNATTNGWANTVIFYWSNDSGTTWYSIHTELNSTPQQSEFTYSWDSTGIQDDTGLYFNATANNGTTFVSDANTGITVDNTAPVITINEPQNNSGVRTSIVTLNVTLTESNPSVTWWELDSNGTNITGCVGCTDFVNTTGSLGDGEHNITVWSNDTLGNENSAIVLFLVGTTPVTVNVKDAENGSDLQGALVNFTNSSYSVTNTTDSDGNTTIGVDVSRLYDITVSKSGYSSNSSLTNQNFSSVSEVSLTLNGNSTLQGYVREIGSDNPLVATVSVYDNSTDTLVYQIQSLPSGYYSLNMPGDFSYYVNFTSSGYASQVSGNYTGSMELNVSLYQAGYGSFTFFVKDKWNERPIPNANVTVEWSVNESGITDSSGMVLIQVPAGGSFSIHASANGYLDNNTLTGLTVTEGMNTNVDIIMFGDSKIYGYVKDSENSQGVLGAFLELWDENNTQKLGWSSYYYNDTSLSSGYYEIYYPSTLSGLSLYVHCNSTGYTSVEISSGGTQQTNINLIGTATVQGKVVDKGNTSVGINEATIELLNATSGSTLYQKSSSANGNFSFNVKNGTNYTLKITKTGYTTYTDATPYQTSHDYGLVQLEGTALVLGKVVDYENQSINLQGVNVKLAYQNLTYITTTDSSGEFELNVSPGYTYDITLKKTGYSDYVTSSYISGYKNLGTITMYGSSLINGTVTDPTRYYSWDRELENVQVKFSESGGSRVFITTTNSNGFYSLYVPSDILSYTITFNKDGFKQKTVSQGGDVQLTGATHMKGRVYDLYNNENLDDVEVCFYGYGDGYYCIDTNASGYYSIDLGVESNYFIYAYKYGYYSKYFGFTDTLGFPYDSGDTGAWDRTEDIGLHGVALIYIKTTDSFSGDPVENSQVCLKKEGEEDCFYSKVTNNNGEASFYAKTYEYYDMVISSMGYPSKNVFDSYYISSGGYSNTISLDAYAKIHVYDQYAEEPLRDIPNVDISLYYYNNETEFNYTLDETVVNVTVACGFLQRDGINVTLNGVTKTTSGSSTVTFHYVPTGLHILEINGTLAGCGVDTKTINVSDGGLNYSFPEFTAYNLNPTNLFVKVQNPAGTGLEGATVTANSTTGGQNYTANETGSGIYNFTYIVGEEYTVYASMVDYNSNSTNYTVTIGSDNNFTTEPLILKPYPGNLSIYVQNSTDALDGISVTLNNGTEFADTTTNGWANFTDMIGVYDIKVNGTSLGYSYNLTEDYFVTPNQNTELTYTLEPTLVTIVVKNQTSHNINQSNVTLWNGSIIAQSATGSNLTALTNSSGIVSFSRVIGSDYNLTIIKTNYTDISTSLELDFEYSPTWNHTYYLNKTMLEVTVKNEAGELLNNSHVYLKNTTYGYDEDGYTDENGNITFDLGSYPGGTYRVDVWGCDIGYHSDDFNYITITEKTLNTETFTLRKTVLNFTINDTEGNPVEDGVIVEFENVTNFTSSGYAVIYGLNGGIYGSINGTSLGYGLELYGLAFCDDFELYETLGITRLTVHVTNSSGLSVENATVKMLNGTSYLIEDNGKGVNMNGTTNSDGNVTFSFVPVGEYKITIEKDSLENYTFYELNVSDAGVNNSLTMYLSSSSTESLDSGNPSDLLLLFTVFNVTSSSIENITVKVQNRTDNSTVAGGLTNSSGQVVLYVPTDNIYNLIVDGELIGYGKVTNYSVPIGQAAVAEACTDVSGWMNLNVHGRTNYKVKTENSYGYYEYDDNDTGVVRNGTYDDDVNNPYVRPSIQIPLTGRTNLTGTIYDAYFVNPVDLSYEPVYSHIDLYYSSDCSGDIRYSTITENNGSYSLHVSPKQLGSDTDMIYCMKVVGTGWDTGYEYNLQFQAGAEELNESMTGAGDVSGYVREVITEKNLEDVNISLRSKNCYGGYSNCEAYRIYTTNGAFQFDVSSHSDYYPYDILLNKTNYFTQEYNDTIYTDNTSLIYYMTPLGRSIFNLNVTGSNLTENVTIKWGDETYYGSHEYCKLENNVLSCLLPSGGRVLTVNGSDIGYGVYSEYKNLVQGQNYSLLIGLNETNVNISIVNQDGAPLDNITVTMGDFENITQNGYVFFNKVSGGTQNVTFSGNLSKIYGMGSQTTEINVTPGVNNTYQYTFNETQFLVIVQNETSDGLSGFMVYLENENNSFQNTTDFSGQSLFRQVPYGNYTMSFNSTKLELLGYQDKNETVEVLLGEDAGSGNNKTVTLKDTEVWFNITNTTSHSLQNINVSLMIESSIAQNGYSMYLTNLTDSNGLVVFHNVIPSEHIGSYYYIVDGNSTGYGMVQKYVTINSSGLNITETLDTNITIPDTTMPVIISISSSVTSSSATIFVTTNESCTCAYNTSDENYSSMTAFSSTGGTSHSTTISGLSATTSYTYYLRCNDTAGNAMNYSNSTTFTTSDIYTGGGSPGGGGGTPTVKIEVSEDKVEISSLSIRSGSSKSMDIEDWSGMIYKIIVYASQTISNGKIIIERINPWQLWEVPALKDYEVYHYLKIDTENIEGKTNNVVLYFSVEKDWMEENSIFSMNLWRYDSGWKKIDTEKVEETADKVKYKSTFPEFSYFAIAGKVGEAPTETTTRPEPDEEAVCGNGICESGETEENCPADCKGIIPEFKLDINLILSIMIIVVAILAAFFYFNEKKKKKPKIVRLPPPPNPITKIKEIVNDSEKYIGKKVMIDGEIKSSEFMPEENRVLYKIKDSTGEISGLCRHAGYEGKGTIEGIIRKKRKKIYIEF